MIRSAYAVVHFNCGHPKCARNDTLLLGLHKKDQTEKNTNLDMFSALEPWFIWNRLKIEFPIWYFDSEIEQAFCELHRKEYE